MSKVYKNGDKLTVNLPFEVVSLLKVKEGDEVDFFKYSDTSFMFAKKSDVVGILTGGKSFPTVPEGIADAAKGEQTSMTDQEMAVLKKLDTLRYSERTKENVRKLLDGEEAKALQSLLKKKIVYVYKKDTDSEFKYSIPKSIYDRFLFGKRKAVQPQESRTEDAHPTWMTKLKEQNAYAELLEANGYIVLPTEAEAINVSTLMEESIRQGLIIGTRGFNKKFYVALKSFVAQKTPAVMKLIEKKSMPLSEISKVTGMDEDAVRTILYLLAENGEVTEVRREIFKAA